MADKTQHVVDNLDVQDSDLVTIKVRCKRRPRYIRAGVAFPFGTSTHVVTWAQLDALRADRAGVLAVSLVEASPGAGEGQAPALQMGGLDDVLTTDPEQQQDGPTPEQEVVLGKEKLARIITALRLRPADDPVVLNGEGKPDLAWLKAVLGEKVTAAERDAALSMMSTEE